jgi:alkylation response protein AidB-like acyl-CoA dehydrogenase
VFFDDVQVPAENLVGEEGRGWTYAKFLLGHERTGITGVGASKRELTLLKEIAAHERKDGKPLTADPVFRQRLAQVEIDLLALEMTLLRVLSSRTKPGPEASILKIKGTEVQQALTELMMDALGPGALPFSRRVIEEGGAAAPLAPEHAAPLAARYFNWRKASIYGGSNEIQRNIIAQQVLGL